MTKHEMDLLYKAKQEWMEKVLASKLTHASVRFALCIYKRMYGVKVESWPDTEDIMADGGFSSSGHFQDFRKALVECGAITAVLDYHTKNAQQKSYKYTLNLDWDGAVAPQGKSRSTSGERHSTSGDCRSTSGASNTPSNTTRKTTMEDNNVASADAAAGSPTILSSKDVPTYSFAKSKTGTSLNQCNHQPVYFFDRDGKVSRHSTSGATEVEEPKVEAPQYRPGLGVRRPKPPETLEEQRAAFAALVVKPRKKPEPDDDGWL